MYTENGTEIEDLFNGYKNSTQVRVVWEEYYPDLSSRGCVLAAEGLLAECRDVTQLEVHLQQLLEEIKSRNIRPAITRHRKEDPDGDMDADFLDSRGRRRGISSAEISSKAGE